jgi:hypothetical protein
MGWDDEAQDLEPDSVPSEKLDLEVEVAFSSCTVAR